MQDFHAGSHLLKSSVVAEGGFVDFYLGHKRRFFSAQPPLVACFAHELACEPCWERCDLAAGIRDVLSLNSRQ